MGGMGERLPRALWLTPERKAAMGRRIDHALKRAHIVKTKMADDTGYTKQQISWACKGKLSIDLLVEIARRTGSSLDMLVFGTFPAADQEFTQALEQMRAVISRRSPTVTQTIKKAKP